MCQSQPTNGNCNKKKKKRNTFLRDPAHFRMGILDKGAGSASYINPGGSQETNRISTLAMICSSAATNDPASTAAVESTQLCKHSSGYPAAEQLGIAPQTSTRNSGMSYGSSNGNSNGSLIQHHHHHHDYGYHHHHHHLVAGSLRSLTVSSAPDSSFVGQQDHHHPQHLDSCSIHSSAVAAVAAAAAAAAALTTYHHHQHQHPHSNLHPASTTTDSASAHQPEHNQLIAPMTQQSIPPKSKPTPARNNSMRNCRSSSTSSSAKKRKRVATVAQRRAANIRERRRMFNLNEAFDKLRRKVPTFAYEKRLSRIETLRLAITYISFMDQVIRNESKAPSAGPAATAAASSSQLPATSGTDNSYRETTSW